MDFQSLLSPITKTEFLERYWQREPLISSRRNSLCYQDLFSYQELDFLFGLCDQHSAPPRASKTDGYGGDKRVGLSDESLLFGQLYSAYSLDNTLVADKIHHKHPKIAALFRNFEETFGTCVDGMIVASSRSRVQGFCTHCDPVEVFVLQLQGRKQWTIWKPDYELPLPHNSLQSCDEKQLGESALDVILEPGDLLYVPRGWIHRVVPLEDSPSLHLTICVAVCSRAELIMELLHTAIDSDPWFRESMPVGHFQQSSSQLEKFFSGMTDRFKQNANFEEALNRLHRNIIAKMQPVADGHFTHINAIKNVGINTFLTKRSGSLSNLGVDLSSGNLLLAFPGNRITAPAHLSEVLSYIQDNDTFKAEDLPGEISPEYRVEIVRRLIIEGWLRPSPDQIIPSNAKTEFSINNTEVT
jgi:ribosomal protein L16 Arg81 hydroxylase